MLNMIKFELRKLIRSKSFYICLAINILITFASMLFCYMLYSLSPQLGGVDQWVLFDYGYNNSTILMLLGIFISIFICEDDSLGTIKNIYSKGYSRDVVYFSKYIVSLIAFFAYFIIFTLFTFGFSFCFKTYTSAITSKMISTFIAKIITVLAFFTLYFFNASVLKKNGWAISLNILGSNLVYLALQIVDIVLNKYEIKVEIYGYWLDGYFSQLNYSYSTLPNSGNDLINKAIIMSVIYILVFLLLGYLINRKRNVK